MLISDAAKEVNVENHVLRYWEEELHLPIKRNELGHRYYTNEDIERFKQIKNMKERGLQLKAIKMILKNGKIDILQEHEVEQSNEGLKNNHSEKNQVDTKGHEGRINQGKAEKSEASETQPQAEHSDVHMAIDIVDSREIPGREEQYGVTENSAAKNQMAQTQIEQNQIAQEGREEKARRLQWLLQQLLRETLQENNQQLCSDIKESVVKELDYQFRAQEEREEERERRLADRNDEYYKKMDELLRQKRNKKKRHFIF